MPLFKRRSSPSAHWSKDFIEHLRTVHFTLVVLAVLAIISGRAPDVAKMRRAKSQLGTIRDFVDNKIKVLGDDSGLYSGEWLIDDKRKIAARMPAVVPIVTSNSCNKDKPEPLQSLRERWTKYPPESLIEFAAIWNELSCSSWQGYLLLEVADVTVDEADAIPGRSTPSRLHPRGAVRTRAVSQDTLQKQRFRIDSLSFDFPYAANLGKNLKFMSRYDSSRKEAWATGTIFVLDLQHEDGADSIGDGLVFMNGAPLGSDVPEDWGHVELSRQESTWTCKGGYTHCFEELADVAAAKENYSFKDLASWLDDQITTTEPRQIDVFGIRFPVESQMQWGIILILTVLLYFWMHLRELSPRLKADHSGLDVAWPALYRSWIAYAVMWTTVVFVPLYALWILGLNRIHYKSPWQTFVVSNWRDVAMWLALPLIIYSVLSVWSCLKLRRLALLADAARQVAECEPVKEETAVAAKASAE